MRLGVDLGGTAIKSGLVDDDGRVLFPETVPTNTSGGAQAVLDALTAVCRCQLSRGSVTSVGIGMPGQVDASRGVLVRAANLPLVDIPLTELLSERLGLPVFLENDANCALYGEIFAGSGRDAENFLLVTVGTGIGGGIHIGGGIYLGIDGRAGEFGHMSIAMDGQPCPCGRKGCWERYASVSALCRMTQKAAETHPDSLLARQIRETGGSVDGRTAFCAARAGCSVAERVLDAYAEDLSAGLNNLTVIFRPNRIVLAGAIFREGDFLLSRIRSRCMEPGQLALSTLNGQAGLIGASLLAERRNPESPIARLLRSTGTQFPAL